MHPQPDVGKRCCPPFVHRVPERRGQAWWRIQGLPTRRRSAEVNDTAPGGTAQRGIRKYCAARCPLPLGLEFALVRGHGGGSVDPMADSTFTLRQADDPASVAMARALFQEYAGAIGTDLAYQGFTTELDGLPAPYAPPGGALLIASVEDDVAGCVALRPYDRATGEMKRLYVREAYRGTGLARCLVDAVIQRARAAGYLELRLDTLAAMTAAQALYRRMGFVEIPPYGSAHPPGTRFYALALDAAQSKAAQSAAFVTRRPLTR